jgi:VanZ family protein
LIPEPEGSDGKPRVNRVLWPLAGILLVFLFAGGPGYHSPRSLHAVWDLGHFVAFSLWSYLLLLLNPFREVSRRRQWGVVISFCLLFGGGTEGIQWALGGDASVGDFLRDLVGGVVTLAWFAPTENENSGRQGQGAIYVSLVLLAAAGFPLAKALADEAIARYQFPVLSDFETPFEIDRWEGGAPVSVDRSFARNGKASLRVGLDTSLYSGVSLKHFPGDWRGYRFLSMEILNPSGSEVGITCRVHDRFHEEGEQLYGDRFNKGFRITPGWNSIRIDLGDIARAPAGRDMDLGRIRSVGLFTTRLPEKRTIFIDFVRLE